MIFYDNEFIENTHHSVQAGCPSQEPLGSLTLAIALTAFGYSGNTANMQVEAAKVHATFFLGGSQQYHLTLHTSEMWLRCSHLCTQNVTLSVLIQMLFSLNAVKAAANVSIAWFVVRQASCCPC